MVNIENVALNADLIVNGYAITRCQLGYRILNLHSPAHASVLSSKGEILETSMDDIENAIVVDYFMKNRTFLED